MPRAPLYTDKVKMAAQYVYDHRLSKEYTNTAVGWDWSYQAGGGDVIFRPNHGLAHSARGALYAPTVIDYYQQHAQKDKEKFQLTPEEIEKIQIALLFRVTGRENECGFSDDPDAYRKYQEAHAKYFRQFCKDNPDIFSKEEIEQYAMVLQSYARPDALDPISLIFKTCHNLDLLRVRDPNGMNRELAAPVQALGQEKVAELMEYANHCLQATGNRILYGNPIINSAAVDDYNPILFMPASTNVPHCFDLISSVPAPGLANSLSQDANNALPLIPDDNAVQTAQVPADYQNKHLIANLLINAPNPMTRNILNGEDYQNIGAVLLQQIQPNQIYQQIFRILRDPKIDIEQRQKIQHNAFLLMREVIQAETPPEKLKPLADWMAAEPGSPDKQKYENEQLVIEYRKLQKLIENDPVLVSGFGEELQLKVLLRIAHQAPTANELKDKIANCPKKEVTIDLAASSVDDSVLAFTLALKSKGQLLLSQMRNTDLASPQVLELSSTKQLIAFSNQLTDFVIQTLLTSKTAQEQQQLVDFYISVMGMSLGEGDYNTAYCIINALNAPAIQRIPNITDKLNNQHLGMVNDVNQFFDPRAPKRYEAALNSQTAPIPCFLPMLNELSRANQLPLTRLGQNKQQRPNLGHAAIKSTAIAKARQIKSKARSEVLKVKPTDIVYQATAVEQQKPIPDTKKMDMSENCCSDFYYDVPHRKVLNNPNKILPEIENLLSMMNSNFELPTILGVVINGTIQSNDVVVYIELLNVCSKLIFEFDAMQNSFSHDEVQECWESMAIWLDAYETHLSRNIQLSSAMQQGVNTLLKDAHTIINNNITIQDINQLKREKATLHKWLEGKPSLYKISELNLEVGPLPKNIYTMQLESLVRGLLNNNIYEIIQNSKSNHVRIIMGGQVYDLAEIFQNANLSHLNFSDEEKSQYAQGLFEQAGMLHFSPCDPSDPTNSYTTITTETDMVQLDNQFLINDPTLNEIHQAERLALNVYTTGFYGPANKLLRSGQVDLPQNGSEYDYIWELVCHSAMAVSGLNGRKTAIPISTFRGEQDLPQSVVDARIKAANRKHATRECGFVSTSKDAPSDQFTGFTDRSKTTDIAIVFKDLAGRDVQGLSAYPHEREFLLPPIQIQWLRQQKLSGGYYLVGKPAVTAQGLTPANLAYKPEDEVNITSNFIRELQNAQDYDELMAAFNTTPKTLVASDESIIEVNIIKQEMHRILNDFDELHYIVNNVLTATPQLEQLGIRADLGILANFMENVNTAYKWHLDQKLAVCADIEALIQIVNDYAEQFTNGPDDRDELLKAIRTLSSAPSYLEAIYDNKGVPPFMMPKVLSDYNEINAHFTRLAIVQHIKNMVHNANTVDELIQVVTDIAKQYPTTQGDFSAEEQVIQQMKLITNDAAKVKQVVTAADPESLLRDSGLIIGHGVNAKLVSLLKAEYDVTLNSAFEKVVADINSLEDLVTLTTEHAGKLFSSSHDYGMVAKEMQSMLEPLYIEAIYESNGIPPLLSQLAILEHPTVLNKFVELAKEQHLKNLQEQKIAKAIQKIQTVDEFIELIKSFEQTHGIILHDTPQETQSMLENLQRFSTNPKLMRNIAKSGNSPLLFGNSLIPENFGIREKFISLVKQDFESKHQQQIDLQHSFQKALSQTHSIGELITVLKDYLNKGLVLPQTEDQTSAMFANMEVYVNRPRIIQRLVHANGGILSLDRKNITSEFGIYQHFEQLVRTAFNAEIQAANDVDQLLNLDANYLASFKASIPETKAKVLLGKLASKNAKGSKIDDEFKAIQQEFNTIRDNAVLGRDDQLDLAYAIICQKRENNKPNGKIQSKKLEALCSQLLTYLESGTTRNLQTEIGSGEKYKSVISEHQSAIRPCVPQAKNN